MTNRQRLNDYLDRGGMKELCNMVGETAARRHLAIEREEINRQAQWNAQVIRSFRDERK